MPTLGYKPILGEAKREDCTQRLIWVKQKLETVTKSIVSPQGNRRLSQLQEKASSLDISNVDQQTGALFICFPLCRQMLCHYIFDSRKPTIWPRIDDPAAKKKSEAVKKAEAVRSGGMNCADNGDVVCHQSFHSWQYLKRWIRNSLVQNWSLALSWDVRREIVRVIRILSH